MKSKSNEPGQKEKFQKLFAIVPAFDTKLDNFSTQRNPALTALFEGNFSLNYIY